MRYMRWSEPDYFAAQQETIDEIVALMHEEAARAETERLRQQAGAARRGRRR